MEILSNIHRPEDIRSLSIKELEQLSSEIREYLITVIPKTGGHFASSLGTVELTVALHYIYDTPRDKIVWDVGHQAYTHKILTGRRDALKTIRQFGGISGFLKRDESEYDVFGAGHASTSISAALGIAAARDFKNDDYKVVAVTGDGSLTGGISFEGLNNAGMLEKDITVILNDNRMSISQNVGAMSKYLASVKINPLYNKLKSEVWDLTGKIPKTDIIRGLVQRIEESIKRLVVPGLWFESLGFKYIGPIDGHNIEEMISFLSGTKDMKGPLFVHIMTQKGKGHSSAEEDPCKYHGVSPLPVRGDIGEDKTTVPSYSNVFGSVITGLAEKNPKICTVTAAMAEGTGLVEFAEKFPGRFFDVGIAESHAVIFAGGLCTEGLRPVVPIYSTFLQRAFDQIVHDAALQSLPVVFALDRAGLSGEDGPTHHGCYDISYLGMCPNIIISAPKDGNELADLLYTALEQDEKPFTLRYPKGEAVDYDPSHIPAEIPLGTWEKISDGEDIVFLAVGAMVETARQAVELLKNEGINPGIVNCRFVKPIDEEMLNDVAGSYQYCVTLEENTLAGGFGSIISRYFIEKKLSIQNLYNYGVRDEFITHGPRDKLLDLLGLSPSKIKNKIVRLVNAKNHVRV